MNREAIRAPYVFDSSIKKAPMFQEVLADVVEQGLVEQLLDSDHGEMKTDLSKHKAPIMEGFERLINGPESLKAPWRINAPEEMQDGKPDLGYIERKKGEVNLTPRPDEIAERRGTVHDFKFFFHSNWKLLLYVQNMSGFESMFKNMMALQMRNILITLAVGKVLDEKLPGYDFFNRIHADQDNTKTRSLYYPMPSAKMHRDQGFLTTEINANYNGLFVYDRNFKRIRINECDPNKTHFFWGRKAWEITRGRLQGLLHGVEDRRKGSTIFKGGEDRRKAQIARTANVTFVWAKVTPEDESWSRAHLSDLTPPEKLA